MKTFKLNAYLSLSSWSKSRFGIEQVPINPVEWIKLYLTYSAVKSNAVDPERAKLEPLLFDTAITSDVLVH